MMEVISPNPTLRFKDEQGNDYHAWEEKKLGAIALFSKGKGITKADIINNGSNECIRYGELYTHYNEKIINIKSKTDLPIANLIISEINDIIIPASGETHLDIATASCILKANVALGGDINIIKTEENGVFLAYYLNNFKRLDIARLSQGISVVHIYAEQLKSLILILPSLNEQQKIASFLSSIDKKIELLEQKKTLLKQYKKGMMQKLFDQTIRFKDEQGNDYPDWKSVQLEDIYSFKSTNSYSRDMLNDMNGSVQNIHYGDIHTKFRVRFNQSIEQIPFINSIVDIDKISEDKYCKVGDIIFADASEDYSDIGKAIEIIHLSKTPLLSGLHTLHARPIIKDIFIGFGAYLMQNSVVTKQIKKIAQGTKVLGISSTRMNKIHLPIPCYKEQQKIANFLSALDDKIELIGSEIDKVREFKKGLMQQMFV